MKYYSPHTENGNGGATNTSEEKLLPVGQATETQIKEWKQKHKYGIYAVTVAGHIAYFKNPGRNELNCAMSKADRDRALALYEELANVTFIGGSEEVLSDDQMFIGVSQELKVKLDGKKATLVNL